MNNAKPYTGDMTPEQINIYLQQQQEYDEQAKINREILKARYATLDETGQPTVYGRSWGYYIFMKLVESIPCWMPQVVMTGRISFPFEMGVPDSHLLDKLLEDCQLWIRQNYPQLNLELHLTVPEYVRLERSELFKQIQPLYGLSMAEKTIEPENEGKAK